MTTEGVQKLFSLIDGRSITIAPGTKRIPGDSITTLLDSIALLETVRRDAEVYRKQVVSECEAIKARAEQEGFQAGYDRWTQMLNSLEGEIKKVRGELQKVVMPVALKAAKKIVATELQAHPELIVDIVSATLKTIAQHKRVVVYICKSDFEYLENAKNELKKIFDELESLSLRERDDIEPGGCIIESEVGIINAQLKDRWRTLEAAFEDLTAKLMQGKGVL